MGCKSSQYEVDEGLLDARASSLLRFELRRLSRAVLRQRLHSLGAAKSEGEGLSFKDLVDTLILWNAVAELHSWTIAGERARVLDAVRSAGLSRGVIEKGLIVAKVPVDERRSLKDPKDAVELLCERLAFVGLGEGEEDRQASNVKKVGRGPTQQADMLSAWAAEPSVPLHHDVKRSKMKPAKRVASAGVSGLLAADAGAPAYGGLYNIVEPTQEDDAPWEGDLGTVLTKAMRNIIDDEERILQRQAYEPESEPSARDRKFNALDEDLTHSLGPDAGDGPGFGPVSSSLPGLRADAVAAGMSLERSRKQERRQVSILKKPQRRSS